MPDIRTWTIGAALAVFAGAGQAQPVQPAPTEPAPGTEADAPFVPIGPSFGESCAPPKLFRTTVRNISPGLAAAARAAQPRRMWRKGAVYFRSEEEPDPVRGGQRVVIVSEPDVWVIDMATRQARHTVDLGPVLEVHAPILPRSPDLPAAFQDLEFGCEPQFVARHTQREERTVQWGATQATLHTVTVDQHSVAVLMDLRRERPLMLSYQRGGRPVLVLRYDDYRHGLPDRPDLFAPGKNIKISEGPPGEGPALPPPSN